MPKNNDKFKLNGEMLTLDKAAKVSGLPRQLLAWRVLSQAKTLDEAVAMGPSKRYRQSHPWRASADNRKPEILK